MKTIKLPSKTEQALRKTEKAVADTPLGLLVTKDTETSNFHGYTIWVPDSKIIARLLNRVAGLSPVRNGSDYYEALSHAEYLVDERIRKASAN